MVNSSIKRSSAHATSVLTNPMPIARSEMGTIRQSAVKSPRPCGRGRFIARPSSGAPALWLTQGPRFPVPDDAPVTIFLEPLRPRVSAGPEPDDGPQGQGSFERNRAAPGDPPVPPCCDV